MTNGVVVEEGRFELAQFADEIQAAESNVQVGTRVEFENDRVRMWDFVLAPGRRHGFHCHRTSYLWVCTSGGRALQRDPDGTLSVSEITEGDSEYLEAHPEQPLIHDLENVGDTTLRFSTVELLT